MSGRLREAWAGLALIAGGALMVALWPVFTTLHGPTSFNEDGHLLGGTACSGAP